ncbi:MAG: DsbC family protein [Gammaproteobacteria bacterium]|jgi:thiol:disulfide interchange protein DsbC|nr:DsbC family protein [Gammaproteobacteria bacterium]MDH3819841.1 DsbC family protein [Gammaproteobacteria bacterium]HKJ21245.1 DsbC family protein [Woeseiaceae bacterium]
MSQIFKPFARTIAAALLLLLAAGVNAADVDPKLEAVRAKMSGMFEFIDPEHVNQSPMDGWYTIQKGSIVAYVSDDGRYLLQGDLIDLESSVNLSEQSRSESRRALMESLDDEDAILFSPAEPKYSVTVFTDVDCTYCRKLHSQIDEYMSQGIAVRYVLYPRNGPASRAWTTSEDVLCSRDRNGALTAAKLDREFQTSKCDASMLTRHYTLGQEVGLSGTPAIVLEDGTLIGGYVTPTALGARLEMAATDQ